MTAMFAWPAWILHQKCNTDQQITLKTVRTTGRFFFNACIKVFLKSLVEVLASLQIEAISLHIPGGFLFHSLSHLRAYKCFNLLCNGLGYLALDGKIRY